MLSPTVIRVSRDIISTNWGALHAIHVPRDIILMKAARMIASHVLQIIVKIVRKENSRCVMRSTTSLAVYHALLGGSATSPVYSCAIRVKVAVTKNILVAYHATSVPPDTGVGLLQMVAVHTSRVQKGHA